MTDIQWTLSLIGAGLGSYLLRAAPFALQWFREFGRRHLRCLVYISFAVTAGIVSRSIFLSEGELTFRRDAWIKVLAVVVAVLLYRRTRNIPVALFSGVGLAVGVRALAVYGLAP